ncbi:MAG: hypothetical protein LQ342_007547 [Letrouitia transgressa]|nr:MAG: hypothetical protein LQ342_007547 [Letrouitia transgressa]
MLPSNNLTEINYGWVDQPDSRGTFDIIRSSFLTIFLCTWSALHLNVPAPYESYWQRWARKLRWALLTLLGPEFVVAFAAGQRSAAKRVVRELAQQGYGPPRWTLRHSLYANMGGFVLHPPDSKPFPIYGTHLVFLVKEGYLSLPEITTEEIKDKSKANGLAKLVTCLQALWFVVQCLGRVAQDLPVSILELLTVTYAWCTFAIYAQWGYKPLDVEVPTVLEMKTSLAEVLVKAGPPAAKPYERIPLDFVWDGRHSWTLSVQPFFRFRVDPRERPIPRILNDTFPWLDLAWDAIVCVFVLLFFAGIHILGWNLSFPTYVEQKLWRIASVALLGTTAALCLWEVLKGIRRAWRRLSINNEKVTLRNIYYASLMQPDRFDSGLPIYDEEYESQLVSWPQLMLMIPLTILYILARLYTMAEALAALRALPVGSFREVDWTTFMPHF